MTKVLTEIKYFQGRIRKGEVHETNKHFLPKKKKKIGN